jgi:hypothetical protein
MNNTEFGLCKYHLNKFVQRHSYFHKNIGKNSLKSSWEEGQGRKGKARRSVWRSKNESAGPIGVEKGDKERKETNGWKEIP